MDRDEAAAELVELLLLALLGVEPQHGLVELALEDGRVDLVRDPRELPVEVVGDVARPADDRLATIRARLGAMLPSATRSQISGSRWRVISASRISVRPAWVDRPTAAA